MRKGIKLTAFLLAVFLVHTFSGCIENEDFVVYGRFKDSYTTDRFEVFCDWEKINPVLDKCDFKEYGLYNAFYDNNDSFPDFEKRMNAIWLNNYPLNDENTNNATLGSAHVSYGATSYR